MNFREFKVNDWVISTSWVDPEPQKITKIELATSPDEEDFVFFGDRCCIEMKYIQRWIPKEGEWCWFWNDDSTCPSFHKFSFISENRYFTHEYYPNMPTIFRHLGFSHCEPFTGELPTCLNLLEQNILEYKENIKDVNDNKR